MNKLLLAFSVCVLFFACQGEQEKEPQTSENEVQISLPKKPERTKLIANIDYLRLRMEAGTDSETVSMLQRGQVMYDLGEVSDFTTKVELRGIQYDEPWLKVETSDGQQGWVFGGGVYFDSNNAGELMDRILEQRFTSFYGKDIAEDVFAYRAEFAKAKTDKAMVRVIEMGEELLREINEKSERVFPTVNPVGGKDAPDLRWLEEAIPGYHLGVAAEGTIYYFYRDLKAFAEKAAKTKGRADDDFVALNIQLYPRDSIEYFFPVYFMQTWDYGGHSLLGEGKHAEILTSANEYMAKHPGTLELEINKIKDDLLQDLTASPQGYWYEKSRILSEIDKIVQAELGILTEKDKIAIAEQKKRMQDPVKNNIKVGLRTGN